MRELRLKPKHRVELSELAARPFPPDKPKVKVTWLSPLEEMRTTPSGTWIAHYRPTDLGLVWIPSDFFARAD